MNVYAMSTCIHEVGNDVYLDEGLPYLPPQAGPFWSLPGNSDRSPKVRHNSKVNILYRNPVCDPIQTYWWQVGPCTPAGPKDHMAKPTKQIFGHSVHRQWSNPPSAPRPNAEAMRIGPAHQLGPPLPNDHRPV